MSFLLMSSKDFHHVVNDDFLLIISLEVLTKIDNYFFSAKMQLKKSTINVISRILFIRSESGESFIRLRKIIEIELINIYLLPFY